MEGEFEEEVQVVFDVTVHFEVRQNLYVGSMYTDSLLWRDPHMRQEF